MSKFPAVIVAEPTSDNPVKYVAPVSVHVITPALVNVQFPLTAPLWNLVPSATSNEPAAIVALPTSDNPVNVFAAPSPSQLICPFEVIKQCCDSATLWNFVPSATSFLPAVIVAEPTSDNPVRVVAPLSAQKITPADVIVHVPLMATDWNFVPSAMSNRPALIVAEPTSLNPVNAPCAAAMIRPSASTVKFAVVKNPPVTPVEANSLGPTTELASSTTPALVTVVSPLIVTDWNFVPSLINNRPAPAVELPTSDKPVNVFAAPSPSQLICPFDVIKQCCDSATLWNLVPSATRILPAVIVAEPTSDNPVKYVAPVSVHVITPALVTVQLP